MQFIITAYDGTDQDALARRMSVRSEHLENMKKVEENAKVICAGSISLKMFLYLEQSTNGAEKKNYRYGEWQ